MTTRKIIALLFALTLLCWLAIPASAQEARGTITGTITDAQKAVMPGVTVIVTNPATNQSRTTISSDVGYFEVPLLNPGTYNVTAEISGFKKTVRHGMVLNVGSKITVDLTMEVGGMQQEVVVTGAAPLLDTNTASSGRVIDGNMIASLPFSDLNPFALTGMASGMQWTGQPEYRRPFDNGGTSAFNTAGGVGQNEYTIDGAPVTGSGRRVGFVPPADAIQEFNLQTSPFDAQVGHTSGALVNVVSKTGTNSFHGNVYDQHWQQRWNATPHFSRLLWEDAVNKGKVSRDSQKQAPGRSNQFGATVGGPVRIPFLYNGKDKLFFFFSYNGIYQSKAETTDSVNRSVPKMAWRNGDFSDLLALDPVKYQIYDPRTARLVGSRVVRDPFPGNKGVPVLNPMYQTYVKFYPTPNDVPGLVSAEGRVNYLASAMPKNEKFNSILNRMDYNINDRHRIAGKWFWNHRLADEYDWTYETARGLMQNGLVRINKGGGGDYTWTVNNMNVFQFGVNYMRFNEGSERNVPNQYKPSGVGLPSYIDQKAGSYALLPRITFDDTAVETVGQGYAMLNTHATTAEIKVSMNTIKGKHSLKYGYSERRYWNATGDLAYTSGSFNFNRNFVRSTDADTNASNYGLGWAAFMMGVPSSISIDTNDTGFWSNRFRAAYLQDDWRVSRKATINLGLRFEREAGITERFNRGLDSGFYADQKLPITDPVQAAYATLYAANSTLGLIAPSSFKVTGGIPYLGQVNKTYTDGSVSFLPRAGIAYQLGDKTVIRGGYGWFGDTLNVNNTQANQFGFSKSTSPTITNDNGLSFISTGAAAALSASNNPFKDPFPVRADGSRFDAPLGNYLGYMALAGQALDYDFYRQFKPALQQRWRIGVQRQLFQDVVFEGAYDGAYASIPVTGSQMRYRINYLPQEYWATGNVRNQALDDDMNRNISSNPFSIKNLTAIQASDPKLYNYLSTVGFFTATTIRKNQLLRLYPHANGTFRSMRPGVDADEMRGNVRYHDVEFRVEKRFSKGFSSRFSYTHVFNSLAKDWLANEFDAELTDRPSNNTLPNRFVWDGVWRLPFGKGHKLAKGSLLNQVAGGWEIGWIWQKQDGPTTGDWGNRFYNGDLNNIGNDLNHDGVWSKDFHQWFNPNAAFEKASAKQPGSYHVRVFPIRLEQLRADGVKNLDVKVQKYFRMTEQANAAFSIDLLNALNQTNFTGPNLDPTSSNFGKVTAQRGLSRIIQLNLRITF